MVTNNDVWDIVKLRLGLNNDQRDLVDSYIYEIGLRIKHFCNINEIPDDLKYTWAAMVIDALRIEQPNMDGIEATTGDGGTVKVGDTSVSSASGTKLTNASKSVIDQVVLNYQVDLIHYRKLRW